jgi:hypothetical protein
MPPMRPLPEEHSGTRACNDARSCAMVRKRVHRISLAAPLHAQAGAKGPTGRSSGLSSHRGGALHRDAVAGPAQAARHHRDTGDAFPDRLQRLCPMGRGWSAWAGRPRQCRASGDRATPRHPCAAWRRDPHRGPQRGAGIGSCGHTPPKGEQVIARIDHHGSVCAPVPVAPVNATERGLRPKG